MTAFTPLDTDDLLASLYLCYRNQADAVEDIDGGEVPDEMMDALDAYAKAAFAIPATSLAGLKWKARVYQDTIKGDGPCDTLDGKAVPAILADIERLAEG